MCALADAPGVFVLTDNGQLVRVPPRHARPWPTTAELPTLNARKLLAKALRSPKGLRFVELCALAEAFGFACARVKGSHRIYVHPELPELINLQDINGMAKPYQVRQLLRLAERYNLPLRDEP